MSDLTYKQQFKLAFLRQCAAEGITDEDELLDRIRAAKLTLNEKAAGLLDYIPGKGAVEKIMTDYALPLGIGAVMSVPLLAGGAAGAAHGLTSFSNDMDVEDAQQQELKEHYEALASQLRASNRAKKMRLQGGRIPRHLRI